MRWLLARLQAWRHELAGSGPERASTRSSRLSSRDSGGGLPRVLSTDTWAISPEEITVCRRPDGSEWELGSGAYGRVFRAMWCEQAVAVKKVRRARPCRQGGCIHHGASESRVGASA